MGQRIPGEVVERRRKVFAEYLNLRDQYRDHLQQPKLFLTQAQSKRLLFLTKAKYRQREIPLSVEWYSKFCKNVQRYLTAVRVESWPFFTER